MKICRRTFLKYGGISALLAGGGGGLYSTLVEPNRLSIEQVIVRIRNLPHGLDGLKIAVLSDFHLYPFTKIDHVSEAIRVANTLRTDLTVLLGDYVDETVDAIHELAPELSRLNSRLGIFSVLGNHDHWKGAKIVRQTLEGFGIHVFENSGVALRFGKAEFFIAGLESAWSGKPDLNSALLKRRNSIPTILLVHEPDYADTSAADGRVCLQLSGHSHGGQIRLPFIGALELPSWGKRYDHGLYRLGDMALYTNRGVGLVDVPVRFNCPPEVTELTLTAA